MDAVQGLVLGAFGGASAAFTGYMKAVIGQKNPEDFDTVKAGLTVLLGAGIGAIASSQGLLADPLSLVGGSAGLATIVENVLKVAYRFYQAKK